MVELDKIRHLIGEGKKKEAASILASIVRKNKNDVDAWLLLGAVLDNPAHKIDCYNQVLKLDPTNFIARGKLQTLGISISKPPQTGASPASQADDQILKLRSGLEFEREETSKLNDVEDTKPHMIHPINKSKSLNTGNSSSNTHSWNIGAGIAGFIVIFVVIYSLGGSSGDSNPICGSLLCVGIIAAIVLWSNSGKERSETVHRAIDDQKATVASQTKSHLSGSSPKSKLVPCRACQKSISRTAPSCPNCGELYPGLIGGCPRCGSPNIQITVKGFSLGKAAAGAVVAGPFGVAGGLHGRKDLEVRCASCHSSTTIKNYEIT